MTAQHATLERATEEDIDELMRWFTSAAEIDTWGGPKFRFPFTPETFRADCHWPDIHSFCLRDNGRLVAFGQIYDRNGRINLARLVVRPSLRGRGIGRRLVTLLLEIGPRLLPLDEYSLFVYRDNLQALRLYQGLGFVIDDYPDDQILADRCYFLTRPVDGRAPPAQ